MRERERENWGSWNCNSTSYKQLNCYITNYKPSEQTVIKQSQMFIFQFCNHQHSILHVPAWCTSCSYLLHNQQSKVMTDQSDWDIYIHTKMYTCIYKLRERGTAWNAVLKTNKTGYSFDLTSLCRKMNDSDIPLRQLSALIYDDNHKSCKLPYICHSYQCVRGLRRRYFEVT